MGIQYTPKLRRTLAYIARHIKESGFSPSTGDVGNYFNISTSSANRRMLRLKKLDLLTNDDGKYRTYTLTPAGQKRIASYVEHDDA